MQICVRLTGLEGDGFSPTFEGEDGTGNNGFGDVALSTMVMVPLLDSL